MQDERRIDEADGDGGRQWDSSEEDIECLLEIARQFMYYLDRLDLSDRRQFEGLLKNGQGLFQVDN